MRWDELSRDQLREALPTGMVVLPVGATEQHGPHLATGTDGILVAALCEQALRRAEDESSRRLVLAPPLVFGASDHHLPFGGTLSLTSETMLSVLLDLSRSIAASGGRRLVIVNGHGGNTGVCHAAAAAASARFDLAVAHIDYWDLVPPGAGVPVPGHGGVFETSLMMAVRPELEIGAGTTRDRVPVVPAVEGVDIHRAQLWRDLQGYTDEPAEADVHRGRTWRDQIAATLTDRLVEISRTL